MSVGPIPEFDVCGRLPTGITVLEASAGTGKTFTIAALAARYVAEGTPLERLLLVTFTRMATGELRDRVRERLVSAEQGLSRALAGVAPPADDAVLGLLAAGAVAEVEDRRHRLAVALADFDAAIIATTHGFCQHVLTGLGVAGDVEGDVAITDDPRQLVDEVVDDLYVRKFHRGSDPPFNLAEARRIGHKVVDNRDAVLEPVSAPSDSDAAMRVRLARAVRGEVDRRRRQAGTLTYDDLLTRLRDTLADPVRGEAACQRLRSRYRVALVDEFQDTDPIQWEILRRAFGAGGATLVLIGDPKQAIYAFRGADVYAYMEAARSAGTRATLGVNFRSDQGLVDGYDAMLRGTRLGHQGIVYHEVQAAEGNQTPRLVGAPVAEPVRVRLVPRQGSGLPLTPKGFLAVGPAREHVAADLAGDVVRLLSSGAEIILGEAGERVGVRPGHVAVLVRRHRDAALISDALGAAGVPAVINGAGSVFESPAAREWLRLLEALERPTATSPARTAALTVFLGWTAEQVATAGDSAWEQVHARLHRWAAVLRRLGVASLLESVTAAEGLPRRALARAGGERHLTDIRHVGQLLHAQAISEQLGVTALTGWLRQRITEAGETETETEDRTRRLESDAEAVQVLTIYRSKGLEFPVVYCPYLWDPAWISDEEPPVFHDSSAGDRRTIDVGGGGFRFAVHKQQHLIEQRGEELRLAYVALTRAQHQAVLWWAPSWDSRHSALCRLLFFRDGEGNVAAAAAQPPSEEEAVARFAEVAALAPGSISIELATGGPGASWVGQARPAPDLVAGRFDRTLDRHWRRTSYSGITAGTYDARVASEAEERVVADEGAPDGPPLPPPVVSAPRDEAARDEAARDEDPERLRSVPALLADMPSGAEVGTFVHGVFERTDFTVADLEGELVARMAEEQARRHIDIGDPAAVAAGLGAAIDTPLGPLMGDVRLRDIGPADRIDELSFELPLVGGDRPTAALAVEEIGFLLAEHLPADDVLAGYARRLADPSLHGALRGYLAGSLDLVARTRAGGGVPRFAVIDYKTNRLADDGQPLSAWHYRPAALVEEMYRSHYPLQALLYTAALHRYMRWRLPGYDPERNLAGVLYLFVRGMVGRETPRVGGQPCGVFAWRPPAPLVEALSNLLDRGRAA